MSEEFMKFLEEQKGRSLKDLTDSTVRALLAIIQTCGVPEEEEDIVRRKSMYIIDSLLLLTQIITSLAGDTNLSIDCNDGQGGLRISKSDEKRG